MNIFKYITNIQIYTQYHICYSFIFFVPLGTPAFHYSAIQSYNTMHGSCHITWCVVHSVTGHIVHALHAL